MSGEFGSVDSTALGSVQTLFVKCQMASSHFSNCASLLAQASHVHIEVKSDASRRATVRQVCDANAISHFQFSVGSLAATTRRRRSIPVNPVASGANLRLGV